MLPNAYELPAGILLVLGGALACFAGYRLFRLVLGIYGFILGAMIASSVAGGNSSIAMIVAALAGGLIGSVVLVFAYFVGIAIAGAGLGALVVHLTWSQLGTGDPSPVLVVIAAVAGAIGAMLLQRYVIVVATAFAGGWTLILGVAAITGRGGVGPVPAMAGPWVLYPLSPFPGVGWVPFAWVALGLAGTAVQLLVTAGKKK
jgi:hypothetical protein